MLRTHNCVWSELCAATSHVGRLEVPSSRSNVASERWIDSCLKGLSLACRRLQMAQESFENRAAELQQALTGEMKSASVEARVGLSSRPVRSRSGWGSRVSPTRQYITCAPTHQRVKRNFARGPCIVKTFGHGKAGRGVFFF